jgi:diguanylate cyclase (GGDEF)-like protein
VSSVDRRPGNLRREDAPDAAALGAVADALDDLMAGGAPAPLPDAAGSKELLRVVASVNRLIGFVAELDRFVTPLAQGDLSAPVPSRDNFLASPFKELHSRLSELTFKASAIAHGDYTQRVDFMGEFSAAFNTMVDLLAEREDELHRLSLLDELTGLWNRRGLFALGDQEFRAAARRGEHLSLVFADLDGLKAINDVHGHERGDEALRAIGHLLHETTRESDIPARIGGDEFVVLLHGGDEAADELMRRFDHALREYIAAHDRDYDLSASLGKAVFEPGSKESLVSVLARADRRMYEAKRAKRAKRTPAASAAED